MFDALGNCGKLLNDFQLKPLKAAQDRSGYALRETLQTKE